jgi:hypothetical protein
MFSERTALIALITITGLMNVCLGFALAMYLGYGPPGLRAIWQSLGEMPRPAADDPAPEQSEPVDAESPPDSTVEEEVLVEVEQISAVAESAIESAAPLA